MKTQTNDIKLSFEDFKKNVLDDYKIAVLSRECSIQGRKEVLTGKAKFGIFGDGKELPQIAMARFFLKGDWRSGYYRDQTFMMAIGELTPEQFFSGLYANTNHKLEPMSAGRQMGGHFASHSLNEDGSWKALVNQYNTASDMSATASQMPRLVGLAQASKLYKTLKDVNAINFSNEGKEVAWGTIGNASTSEGLFFETINAAGVLQVPLIISVWDDEYGISVHAKHHTTKENISEVLKGFQRNENDKGWEIFTVNGWDYPQLIETYEKASTISREEHVPVLIHVLELTQPQGHSTSGSHERYKSKDRLDWEKANDCNEKMRAWIISSGISDEETLIQIEQSIKKEVKLARKNAWQSYIVPIKREQEELCEILDKLSNKSANGVFISKIRERISSILEPNRKDIYSEARKSLRYLTSETSSEKNNLIHWLNKALNNTQLKYSSHLYSETTGANIKIEEVKPVYNTDSQDVDGRIILRDNFDALFNSHPNALIFGEDTGKIGDVNQGLEGLQEKYGEIRIADTGIRESTIIGQGIGMALRGLRPIAEIQYLDYILYAIQSISDDLACLHYRTKGKQKAPLIIRTRGHRLEGIWHSGSQMAGILSLAKGVNLLVPRNMTKAAGFYNTLMLGDDPAIVVESLNGYRLKEKMPSNLGGFRTPIGLVEVVKEGTDITLVSYGSTFRLVEAAAKDLLAIGIDAEIIDVQSLMPFDLNHDIVKSIAKTNRIVVIDEDIPGGASAYILDHILNVQNAFQYLDSSPKTLSAKPHRPAYGTDGDYFSKPSVEDIFEVVYNVMHEFKPKDFPKLR